MSENRTRIDPPEEDFGIQILKNGTWLHRGAAIERLNLVKLFATVLRRDENGDFWLQTPVERGRITVDDAPFVAVELRRDISGDVQALHFRTNIDEWVRLDAEHPLIIKPARDTGQLTPYIHIRGGLEARVDRSVYYELAALAESHAEQPDLYGVNSAGTFFALMTDESVIQE